MEWAVERLGLLGYFVITGLYVLFMLSYGHVMLCYLFCVIFFFKQKCPHASYLKFYAMLCYAVLCYVMLCYIMGLFGYCLTRSR